MPVTYFWSFWLRCEKSSSFKNEHFRSSTLYVSCYAAKWRIFVRVVFFFSCWDLVKMIESNEAIKRSLLIRKHWSPTFDVSYYGAKNLRLLKRNIIGYHVESRVMIGSNRPIKRSLSKSNIAGHILLNFLTTPQEILIYGFCFSCWNCFMRWLKVCTN